jgi:hypothetical protein
MVSSIRPVMKSVVFSAGPLQYRQVTNKSSKMKLRIKTLPYSNVDFNPRPASCLRRASRSNRIGPDPVSLQTKASTGMPITILKRDLRRRRQNLCRKTRQRQWYR